MVLLMSQAVRATSGCIFSLLARWHPAHSSAVSRAVVICVTERFDDLPLINQYFIETKERVLVGSKSSACDFLSSKGEVPQDEWVSLDSRFIRLFHSSSNWLHHLAHKSHISERRIDVQILFSYSCHILFHCLCIFLHTLLITLCEDQGGNRVFGTRTLPSMRGWEARVA